MLLKRRSYLPLWAEVIAAPIARLLYRVRSRGAEGIPATGGALIVANHLSYVDVAVLQLACPRPLRFLGHQDLHAHTFFSWVFKIAGVIPVTADQPEAGAEQAVRALKAGELVCAFPEGGISRTGQLMRIKPGFDAIARAAGVLVIPAAIDGLWGSVFSFAEKKYIWKSPRLMPTAVFVAFGRPILAEKADLDTTRQAMLNLTSEAFEERPVLRRHIGREVVRSLAKRPGRIVVVDCTQERRPVTAAKLLGAAIALSRHLRKTLPDGRVGIVLPPGVGALIANLSVICAGKVPVNMNFTVHREAIDAAFRLGGFKTVISAEAMKAKLPNFPWPDTTVDLKEAILAAGGPRAILPWILAIKFLPNQWIPALVGLPRRGDRAEAALLFTSGSAGEPKGVVLTHRNILANCDQISSLSILPPTCIMLGCLPLFHSFGCTATMWYPLLRSCGLVTVPSPLDTRKIIDAIRDEKVTVLVGAPTFLRPILKKAEPSELKSLGVIASGAEKLPEDLYKSFLEIFNLEIFEGYGLTETSPVTSINQPDPPVTTATAKVQLGKKTGSVGRLMPGMTGRIVDPDTRQDLPPTSFGEVWVKGANVFSGYLLNEEKTRAVIKDGWFATGDLGHFDDDGFLTIAGRLSRFSKIGGEMVPLGTIEEKINELFGLDPAEGPSVVVVGIPDPTKGEALALVTSVPITPEMLREKLGGAGMPNLWIPKIVVRVDAIPHLETGKLDLSGCRKCAIAAGKN